ncbi:TetR/AcrR family transcriptional regulator [Terriglobus tenax]|uniref:TetR/AcrR family transcriptional regulator n=1 Tax=Terriglobus tenax TaxID=1111115 RepID=UPI0021DF5489|nr:TetR/AcrR family transcriptional regulator [Terriglobus tenax]
MRYSVEQTQQHHRRIIQEASRLFRERGFEHVTVSEVMKAAGLTHGAFYAHFQSKDELQAAAVEYGLQQSLGRIQQSLGSQKERKAYLDRYLSPAHRDTPGDGCTMAALGEEIARCPEVVRQAFTREVKELLKLGSEGRGETIRRTALMVGAMVLARAIDDETFSGEILREARKGV